MKIKPLYLVLGAAALLVLRQRTSPAAASPVASHKNRANTPAAKAASQVTSDADELLAEIKAQRQGRMALDPDYEFE